MKPTLYAGEFTHLLTEALPFPVSAYTMSNPTASEKLFVCYLLETETDTLLAIEQEFAGAKYLLCPNEIAEQELIHLQETLHPSWEIIVVPRLSVPCISHVMKGV